MRPKLIGIKTNEGYYVKGITLKSDLCMYFINSDIPDPTFDNKWYFVKTKPKTLQYIEYQPNINYRYELIDKTFTSNKVPLTIPRDVACEYSAIDYEWYWRDEYKQYASLYELKSDPQEPKIINIEFEYEELFNIKEIKRYPEFKYEVQRTQYKSDGTRKINEKDIIHQEIDKIIFPPIILPQRPCKLTVKASYGVIREYVKNNINPRHAEITSDYDFCFTVKKKIPLHERQKYTVNVNALTKRKAKYETRYIDERNIIIFEMSPEGYSGYPIIEAFQGKDAEDLDIKIKQYCEDLIDFINEPVTECPNCKGRGVILKESMTKK